MLLLGTWVDDLREIADKLFNLRHVSQTNQGWFIGFTECHQGFYLFINADVSLFLKKLCGYK